MSRKNFIVAAVAIFILGGLFYFSAKNNGKTAVKDINIANNISQPFVSWQKITITEEEKNIFIETAVPRVVIYSNDGLENKVNKAVVNYLDLLKDDFIFSVSTAAEDNEETNALTINTEILLLTPRLISLAFTETHHLAGAMDHDPEQTFLVFDLARGEPLLESNKLFHDDTAWSKAVRAMKASLLSNYQGEPNCDLLFAPKYNGFTASCIGLDWSRGGEHVSIKGDIPISMIQEFLSPSALFEIK